MKPISFILLFVSLQCFSQTYVSPIEMPEPYVEDLASVLSSEEEEILEEIIADFDKRTSAQILLYITDTLYGKTSKDFTMELFDMAGVGQKHVNNGVIILIAPYEKELRITVGYGMEWPLSDSITKIIVDNMIPLLKTGKYFEASMLGVKQVIDITSTLPWYTSYQSYANLMSDSSESLNKVALIKVEKIIIPDKKKGDYHIAILKFKNNPDIILQYTKYMDQLIHEIKNKFANKIFVRVIQTTPLTVRLLGTVQADAESQKTDGE